MKRKLSWLLIALILITSIPLSPTAFAETPEGDLIISEYVEGSGFSKAIELYNGTGRDIDLSTYSLYTDTDGLNVKRPAVSLKGILSNDSVYVVVYDDNRSELLGKADLLSKDLSFNGNDQIYLFNGSDEIDHVGILSTEDGFGSSYLKDKTFIRNSNITTGAIGSQNINTNGEWTKYAKNHFSDLGQHVSVQNLSVAPVTSNVISGSEIALNSEIILTTATDGATIKVATKVDDVYGEYQDYAPITVTGPITFKAKAIKEGSTDSSETEFTYTIRPDIAVTKIADGKTAYVDVVDPKYLDDNEKIKVQGTVTAIKDNYIYIQDDTAGLGVEVTGATASIGDEVEAYGLLGSDFDFMYLKVDSNVDFKVLSSSAAVTPKEVSLADINDAVEGQLVILKNFTAGDLNDKGEFAIDTAGENIVLKANDTSWIQPGKTYESYTGVVYYAYAKFQLLTRTELDVVENSMRVRSIKSSLPSGMISKNDTVTLSTLTEGVKIYYSTDLSDPDASSNEYTAPITITSDSTIKAIALKDGLESSDILTLNYVVNESLGTKTISEIQGESHTSPYVSKTVEDVEGVITALLNYKFDRNGSEIKGFYMQGVDDNNDATSDAIFVYSNDVIAVGDKVTVSGIVVEQVKEQDFYAYDQSNQLSVTTLQNTTVTIASHGNALPEAITLGIGGRIVPHDKVSSVNFSEYDVTKYAIDFYESLECMLVTANNPVIVGPNVNSVITILPDDAAIAKADGDINSQGGVVLSENDTNTERLPLNGAINSSALDNLENVKMGEKLASSVKGIMEYEWGAYQIYLTDNAPDIVEAKTSVDTYKYAINEDELRIGSFNVYNHGGDDKSSKTKGIASQIVNSMLSPDIIGLVEVQDNDGKSNEGIVDASEVYEAFITEISALGGPTYAWTDIAPVNNAEGGQQSGNIRVGFLYNPERVTLKAGTKGGSTETVTIDDNGHLTKNPGRIATTAPAFDNTRKSLAAEFTFKGEDVIVIANHLKSKGGDNGIFGNVQLPVLTTEAKRTEQAQLINDFVDSILVKNADANVVVLGDFNDFQFSNPIKALEGSDTVLNDLIDTLPLAEQFTYMYGGNAQVLDHILVTDNLVNDTKFDAININSILSKDAADRHSDHDPVVAAIANLGITDYVAPVESSANGDVVEGTTVTLTSTTSDATIYYSTGTLDLMDMSKNTEYTEALTINTSQTIQAIAVKGDLKSDMSSFDFNVILPAVTASKVGAVEKDTEITLTCIAEGATIYYSTSELDLSDVTNNTEYTSPLIITEETTIKAIAVKGDLISAVNTFNYTIKLPTAYNTTAEARAAEKGTEVILDVVITSQPGAFGNKAFTFQDDTAGGYVHTSSLADEFVLGSHVKLIGKTSEYNGMFQISMTSIELLDEKTMPVSQEIEITNLGEEFESELITFKGLRIGDLSTDKYKNTYINAVKDNQVIKVKLDSRSGTDFGVMSAKLATDNIVDITAVVYDYKGSYSLKIRSDADVTVTSKGIQLYDLQTLNLNNEVITTIHENDFINLSVKTKSEEDMVTGLLIFKIEKEGKPYRIGFAGNAQSKEGHYSVGFDTTNMTPGTYSVTTYFWNSIIEMISISNPKEVTFTIE